jgi:hypothetical protein
MSHQQFPRHPTEMVDGRWSNRSVRQSVFENHWESLIIDGSMVGHRPKLLGVPFTNKGC